MNFRAAIRIRQLVVALTTVATFSFAVADGAGADERPKSAAAFNGQPMTAERLAELVIAVDDEAVLDGATWFFHVADLEVVVVYDVSADRMRILIPIGDAGEIEADEILRLMQANFDSALDARYAIANGTLWGAFIHPLSTLTDEEFLVGIGQTANVVMSYGTSYSSGLFIFGNGDSAEIERNRLIESLRQTET